MTTWLPPWLHSVGPLAAADVRHRYAGSLLGGVWAVVGPLVEVAAYAFVFTRLVPAGGADGVAYTVFVAAGLLPWSSLREGLEGAGATLGDNRWIRRSRVPFELLVARHAVAAAVRGAVGVALVLTAVSALWPWPGLVAFAWPLLGLVLQTLGVYGLGLLLAPAGVLQPDLRPALASALTLLTFASPILYPGDILPGSARAVVEWNPYTHLLRLFRAPLPGAVAPSLLDVGVVGLTVAVLLGTGLLSGRRLAWAARDRL